MPGNNHLHMSTCGESSRKKGPAFRKSSRGQITLFVVASILAPLLAGCLNLNGPPTAAPVNPQDPDDPLGGLDLSNPDYTDDFSNQNRWYSGLDDAGVRLAYEGEAFAATDKLTDLFIFYRGSTRSDSNFYAEIDMSIGPCSGRDGGGMAVRVDSSVDYDRSYVFEVACNGEFRLRRFIDYDTIPLVLLNWTYSAAIHTGPNVTNRIGVLADGNELYLFANGVLLTQNPIVDNAYAQGIYGIFASAAETPSLKVLFDNFAVWVLAP